MAAKSRKTKKPGKKTAEDAVPDEILEEGDEVETAAEEPEIVDAPEEEGEDAASKRGRAVKEPPPPKYWRVEGMSPEGVRVILGRFVTREEAEPELVRIKEDGFYDKVRLVDSTPGK
ncbi:MAG: hypothetical protein KF841_13855 [Phycisphaerae bacterium]|nr:hypothetical protein [Phycisphaerae bacterium]